MLNQEGCVWLVIPVHNRRSITMRCLGNLKSCGVFAWARAVVVDDGSTDGTSDAIRAEYQDLPLTILRGDGNLWWTGAIELGMRFALERGATAVIWLNDDCFPAAGSLRLLADLALTGRCATTTQARTVIGTYYGGYEKYPLGLRRVICPAGVKTLACDASNGNCVCFPRAIIEKIGFPDAAAFPQNHGDSDYTLRVTEAGFACLIVGEAACVNELEGPPHSESWLLTNDSVRALWKCFYHRKSPLHFASWAKLNLRHWGPLRGSVLFLLPYLRFGLIAIVRLLTPRALRTLVYGRRSPSWQTTRLKERRDLDQPVA